MCVDPGGSGKCQKKNPSLSHMDYGLLPGISTHVTHFVTPCPIDRMPGVRLFLSPINSKENDITSPFSLIVFLFPSSLGCCQVAVASRLVGCSIRASRLSLVGDSLEGVPLSDSSVAALNGIVTRAPLWSRETLRGRYTGNANRREPATKEHLATGGVGQKQPTLCPSDITNREPLHFGSAPHRWGRRQSAPRLTVIRDTRAVRPSCLSRTTRLPFESLLFRYTTLRMFVFFLSPDSHSRVTLPS